MLTVHTAIYTLDILTQTEPTVNLRLLNSWLASRLSGFRHDFIAILYGFRRENKSSVKTDINHP